MTFAERRRETALALGIIIACLVGEATLLRVGIDDLDEGYFLQQAVRVLHGQIPYRDFQTLYAPGLAYAHATLFGLLGGPFVLAPRVLALAARAGLSLLLFVVARPLVHQPLWAAVPGVFVLIGLDDAPVLWEPHPGWLSTLFAVCAAWCLSHRPSGRWLVGAGVAAGVAYAFKQNTGAFILAAILVRGLWAASPSSLAKTDSPWGKESQGQRNADAASRVRVVLVPLATFAAVTAVWLVPLVVALRGDVTQLGVLVGAVSQAGLFAGPEWPILVPVLCLAGGLWLARRQPADPRAADPRLRWYLLAGSALFLTQYPRMDALHLAWSAPLLLVVGAVTLDRLRPVVAGVILLAALALTAPTITTRLAAVQQPHVAITHVPYANGLEVPSATREDVQGVIADIRARTNPNEPIFVYPTSPLLYALAERPNATRFDHLNPGAADARQIDQVIADLAASRARLVVVSDFWQAAWGPPGPNAPLETWLATHFTEVARDGAYRVLVPAL